MGSDGFEGQGFVVIGGTEGVGREAVLLSARRGAHVLFSGPPGSERAAEQVVAEAQSEGMAERLSFVVADCSQQAEVDRVFDAACDWLPALSVLVVDLMDHAFIFQDKNLLETSLAEWNQGLSANLRRPFLITQRAVEEFLIGGEGGRLVYIVAAAQEGAPAHVSVAAAQTALVSFVRSAAKEYGRRGVAFNVVSAHGDAGRSGAAADTVLFFCSPAASFVA
jgi:NAD(P)-dependent dehydrogenase (short-subunit alcohol dehydrogenase family)